MSINLRVVSDQIATTPALVKAASWVLATVGAVAFGLLLAAHDSPLWIRLPLAALGVSGLILSGHLQRYYYERQTDEDLYEQAPPDVQAAYDVVFAYWEQKAQASK